MLQGIWIKTNTSLLFCNSFDVISDEKQYLYAYPSNNWEDGPGIRAEFETEEQAKSTLREICVAVQRGELVFTLHL